MTFSNITLTYGDIHFSGYLCITEELNRILVDKAGSILNSICHYRFSGFILH
jgi:hypothetical protein